MREKEKVKEENIYIKCSKCGRSIGTLIKIDKDTYVHKNCKEDFMAVERNIDLKNSKFITTEYTKYLKVKKKRQLKRKKLGRK